MKPFKTKTTKEINVDPKDIEWIDTRIIKPIAGTCHVIIPKLLEGREAIIIVKKRGT